MKPGKFLLQADDRTYDDQGGRFDAGCGNLCRQGREVRCQDTLAAGGAVLHDGGRVVRGQAVRDQLAADFGEAADTHVEDDGQPRTCQRGPVEIDRAVLEVAGGEGDRLRVLAMGQRDAGVGRAAGGCGDAWNDFKGDTGVDQGLDFLATATENKGVATLETDHFPVAARESDEQAIEFFLRQAVVGAFLAL